jgi:hypothetical protein
MQQKAATRRTMLSGQVLEPASARRARSGARRADRQAPRAGIQYTAQQSTTCCNVGIHGATEYNVLQRRYTRRNRVQRVATHVYTAQQSTTWCNACIHGATEYNVVQRMYTRRNRVQRGATQRVVVRCDAPSSVARLARSRPRNSAAFAFIMHCCSAVPHEVASKIHCCVLGPRCCRIAARDSGGGALQAFLGRQRPVWMAAYLVLWVVGMLLGFLRFFRVLPSGAGPPAAISRTRNGLTPRRIRTGTGAHPLPHPHRDWGSPPATSAPGLGLIPAFGPVRLPPAAEPSPAGATAPRARRRAAPSGRIGPCRGAHVSDGAAAARGSALRGELLRRRARQRALLPTDEPAIPVLPSRHAVAHGGTPRVA